MVENKRNRGRPRKEDKDRKDSRIVVRFTEDEPNMINKLSEIYDMSNSDIIRKKY